MQGDNQDQNKKPPQKKEPNKSEKSLKLQEVSEVTNEQVPNTKVKEVEKPCPKAIVQPTIVLLEDGWYDDKKADHFVPAKIKVGLLETTSGLASTTYAGSGTVAAGGLKVYTDKGCTAELTTKVGNSDLRSGKELYVKGTAVENKTATVTLDAAIDPSKVTVLGPASVTMPFKKVNVITPEIKLQSKVVLVNHTPVVDGKKTTVCKVELSLEQTNTTHKLDSLKASLTYGSEVECFKDSACTQALVSGSELTYQELTAQQPKLLYLQGKTEGEPKLALEPVQQVNLAKSYRLGAKKEETLAVVKIELKVYAWAEARNYSKADDGTYVKTEDGKAGEGRELHYQDGGVFKRGKIVVMKPHDLLWTYGSDQAKITLTPDTSGGASLHFYTSADGNTRVTELKKADLGGDKTLWIQATGTTALGGAPKYRSSGWSLLSPVKQSAACSIQLGAKVQSPDGGSVVDLKFGDGCEITTYSFDRHLDRQTRNDSHLKIRAASYDDCYYKHVALADAGLHDSYGTFYGPCVNLNYDSVGAGIFVDFLKALGWGKNADRANRGTNYVADHLLTMGEDLHDVTGQMIFEYILGKLNADRDFDKTRGVPGVHAEVLAVNRALQALAAAGENPTYSTATLSSVTVATYKLQDSSLLGRRFPACENCSGILTRVNRSVRVITG